MQQRGRAGKAGGAKRLASALPNRAGPAQPSGAPHRWPGGTSPSVLTNPCWPGGASPIRGRRLRITPGGRRQRSFALLGQLHVLQFHGRWHSRNRVRVWVPDRSARFQRDVCQPGVHAGVAARAAEPDDFWLSTVFSLMWCRVLLPLPAPAVPGGPSSAAEAMTAAEALALFLMKQPAAHP